MIVIKNLRNEKPKDPWDFVVDRTSVLGNPFRIGGGRTRKQVCNDYKKWFESRVNPITIKLPLDQKIQYELGRMLSAYEEFGTINLFCWCTPKQCHSETIKEYLERTINERKSNKGQN